MIWNYSFFFSMKYFLTKFPPDLIFLSNFFLVTTFLPQFFWSSVFVPFIYCTQHIFFTNFILKRILLDFPPFLFLIQLRPKKTWELCLTCFLVEFVGLKESGVKYPSARFAKYFSSIKYSAVFASNYFISTNWKWAWWKHFFLTRGRLQ